MIKVKHERTADCVVGGFRWHKAGDGVGSLLLGLFDDAGVLHHVGVASGFSAARRKEFVDDARALPEGRGRATTRGDTRASRSAGCRGARAGGAAARILSWEALRPELVAEVAYDHLQVDRFRHATSFAGGDRTGPRRRAPTRSSTPRCPPNCADVFGRPADPRVSRRSQRGGPLGQRRVTEVAAHRVEVGGRSSPAQGVDAVEQGGSRRRVARSRKSSARVPLARPVVRPAWPRPARPSVPRIPVGRRRRACRRCSRSGPGPTDADRLPHPASPGKPSAESPTRASQSGMERGATPNFSHTPASSHTVSRRRSSWTTRLPTTHWARSLSGVQMTTWSTSGSSAATAAAEARASSASSSTIGHTATPRATRAHSSTGNWDRKAGSIPSPVL